MIGEPSLLKKKKNQFIAIIFSVLIHSLIVISTLSPDLLMLISSSDADQTAAVVRQSPIRIQWVSTPNSAQPKPEPAALSQNNSLAGIQAKVMNPMTSADLAVNAPTSITESTSEPEVSDHIEPLPPAIATPQPITSASKENVELSEPTTLNTENTFSPEEKTEIIVPDYATTQPKEDTESTTVSQIESQTDSMTSTPSDTETVVLQPRKIPQTLHATYMAQAKGIHLRIEQNLQIEQSRYLLTANARKFGFQFNLTSQGEIDDIEGFKPDLYEFKINNTVKRVSTVNYNTKTIEYGKPSALKQMPLEYTIQDYASFIYQLAFYFDGDSQTVQFSSGNAIYRMEFKMIAHEIIQVGGSEPINTLHIRGTGSADKNVIADVWLALDHQNLPVTMEIKRQDERIQMYLEQLDIDGQSIFRLRR